MPNGFSEGEKVKRWKPVLPSDRAAQGVTAKKVSRPFAVTLPFCLDANMGRRAVARRRITVTGTAFHLLRAERTATFCPLLG